MKKLFSLLLVFLTLCSCSKLSQDNLDILQSKVDSAKVEGLPILLSDKMIIFEDSMKSLIVLTETEKSKIIFQKDFDPINKKINQLTSKIDSLRNENMKFKNIMDSELRSLCREVDNLTCMAPKSKDGRLYLEDIQLEIDTYKYRLNTISESLFYGKYELALKEYTEVKIGLNKIKEELLDVIEKIK